MFKAINFATYDYCNRSCSWCPNVNDVRKTNEEMTLYTFYNIINQLKDIKYEGIIAPFGNNEPLADPLIFALINEIHDTLPNNKIALHTNGDGLSDEKMLEKFLISPIDDIVVNCYDDEKHLKELKSKLKPIENRVRFNHIQKPLDHFWNRGGNVPNIKPSSQSSRCFIPFEWLSINHKGDVYLCCSDWKYEVTFGNINNENILDIWYNEKYQKYRIMHDHNKGKEMPLCNRCNLIK